MCYCHCVVTSTFTIYRCPELKVKGYEIQIDKRKKEKTNKSFLSYLSSTSTYSHILRNITLYKTLGQTCQICQIQNNVKAYNTKPFIQIKFHNGRKAMFIMLLS